MSASDIAEQVGCSVNLVYNVKARHGRAAGGRARRREARPRVEGLDNALERIIATLRESDRERKLLRRTLEQVRALVDSVA